tara:strand:+ start:527 stop:961 length:435 start_codon:yes stop_codon:yes gene_type:complete
MKILIINGPNLNMLGKREKDTYGSDTLEEINNGLLKLAESLKIEIAFFQSNAEHDLVSKIQESMNDFDALVINPGAFTHTSISIRDAILAVDKPFYEVHISNIFNREEFRQKSYFSDLAVGVISGLGASGYQYALEHAVKNLKK